MTVKRDLKRRVRQRQARTGEAYVTARRHVVAAQAPPADGDADDGDADDETDSEAVEPADAATASAEPGAPGVAADTADTAPAIEAAAPGATARAIPAEDAGAVAAEIDTADTGPVRATAASPAAVAPGRDDTAAPAPADPAPENAAGGAVSVVELLDVSEEARRVGLVCRVMMFPGLAARVEPASVLARLRDLLVETAGDPHFLLFSQVALTGSASPQPPRLSSLPSLPTFDSMERFFRRARAGVGGVSDDGLTLAFHVAGRECVVTVGCAPHWSSVPGRAASLMLSGIDDLMIEISKRRDWILAEARAGTDPGRQIADLLTMRVSPRHLAPKPFAPTLYVVHDGRRYAITQDEFLIGRSAVHLAIKDGLVSRHHAAVIRRNGVHYLKDLGSTHGITYKGMQIDNKRIDEGDVFQIGDHELRFTYRGEDEK
jgi:hypothetical protein